MTVRVRRISPRMMSNVFGCGGSCLLAHGEQLAFDEPSGGTLRRTLRDADRFSQLLIADPHCATPPKLFNIKPEVHQKGDRAPVVADKIAHENGGDVVVYLSHAIPIVSIATYT